MTCSLFKKWVLARQMALAGYAPRIIIIEAGITYKQLRNIYKELEDAGLQEGGGRGRRIKKAASILKSTEMRRQASCVIKLYRNIGGEEVLYSTSLSALNKSYKIFIAAHRELEERTKAVSKQKNPKQNDFLDMTDAWCLALALRSGEGEMIDCEQCHITYFTSGEEDKAYTCPFCED